jgi:nucleoside-diphosphate-sugar epimerase
VIALNYLVTGGAGFIGTHVVRALNDLGHHTTILDDCSAVVPDKIRLGRRSHTYSHIVDTEYIPTSVCSIVPNAGGIEHSWDAIIHLASPANQRAVDLAPSAAARTMTQGVTNMLEACGRNCKFIYISSSMVYGNFYKPAKETDPCNPTNLYGLLKLQGEQIVQQYAAKGKIKSGTIIRPSAVYGPLDSLERVLCKFMIAAQSNETLYVRGPNELFDFSSVYDVADGIAGVVETEETTDNQIYNITRGIPIKLIDAAELCVQIAGGGKIQVEDAPSDYPRRHALDNAKAFQDFGYTPHYNIEDGLQELHDYVKHTFL